MASLSKNKIKFIHSLELKKIRKEERVFLAEGPKLVGDLLGHFPCRFLAATPSWLQEHPGIDASELVEVSQEDLSRASLLKTPQQVLAIFEQPQYTLDPEAVRSSLCLALDDVQDPGNVGTIIRTADAAGYDGVFISQHSADIYNLKTLRSMQGSHFHLPIYRVRTSDFLNLTKQVQLPILATTLSKDSMDYRELAPLSDFALVLGNEGQGISHEMAEAADNLIHISMKGRAESLNVAVAAGILIFALS